MTKVDQKTTLTCTVFLSHCPVLEKNNYHHRTRYSHLRIKVTPDMLVRCTELTNKMFVSSVHRTLSIKNYFSTPDKTPNSPVRRQGRTKN